MRILGLINFSPDRKKKHSRNKHRPVLFNFDRLINRSGSGRVFSGSGIRPKYGAGMGKMVNILTGSGIWLLPGKRDSPKFGHGIWDFFTCLLGIQEIVTTQINVLTAKATGVSFQIKLKSVPVNSYLIETVRGYFVSTRCQKRPCGVRAYQ